MKKFNLSRSGFGLVEVLVVIGILAIVSLGTVTVVQNMYKGVTSAQKSANRTDTMKSISTALSNKETCKLAMGAGTLNIPASWSTGTNNAIAMNRIQVGTEVLAQVDVAIDQIRTKRMRLEMLSGPFPVQYNIAAAGATPSLRNYRRYFSKLVVSPEKVGGPTNNLGGEALRDSEFRVALLVSDTNSLVDCFGGMDESDLQALCEKAFEGQYDPTRYPWCGINNLSIGIHRASMTAQYPRFAVLEKQNGTNATWDLTMALYGNGSGSSNGPGLWFVNAPTTAITAAGSFGVIGYANRNDAYTAGTRAGDFIIKNLSGTGDLFLGTEDNQVRLRQNSRQVDFNQGISITTSTVGAVATRHPLSIHSPDGQSRIVLSGASDNGQTYSAIYLGNNEAHAALTNSWVMAHKANLVERDQFQINRWVSGAMTIGIAITPALNVGIGTGTPSEKLDVSGNAVINGNLRVTGIATALSDRRLKKNIHPLRDSLQKVQKLLPVTFNWLDVSKPEEEIGFIAQEVEKVFPEVVRTSSDGLKSVAYSNMVAIVTGAIQELMALFEAHDSRFDLLEKQMTLLIENQKLLEKRNKELEAKIELCYQ